MKVAIVHYWFTSWRGGERVVEELLRLFPGADVYTHAIDPRLVAARLPGVKIHETFIARLPFGRRLFRFYLPFMPKALEDLDLQSYDLIISSESGPAKGIIKRPDAIHVCYCHSPMRYIWDLAPIYRRQLGFLKGGLLAWISPFLRMWDVTTAARVDQFIANSAFVARRISSYYGRDSVVIHPPVNIGDNVRMSTPSTDKPYFLLAGELVAYKRADLAIEAANTLGYRLVVVGDGEQKKQLVQQAGDTVEFVGRVPDDEFRLWLSGARALIFPGLEDFGIVPVEAMARGTPIIVFAQGGALEYLQDGINGVGFTEQNCDSVVKAIRRFESLEQNLTRGSIRETVMKFNAERFRRQVHELISKCMNENDVGAWTPAVTQTLEEALEPKG